MGRTGPSPSHLQLFLFRPHCKTFVLYLAIPPFLHFSLFYFHAFLFFNIVSVSVPLPHFAVVSGNQLGKWPRDTRWKDATIC